MVAFVSEERAIAQSTSRTFRVTGCADPDDVPVIDFVNTHRQLGLAVRVAARVFAGASATLLVLALAL